METVTVKSGVLLDEALGHIRSHFMLHDKYQAHEKSQPVVEQIGKDKGLIFEVIRRNIINPSFFDQVRVSPVMRLVIAEEPNFSFMFHGWMPRPDRSTHITHQSVHHHGDLLLSTYSCFGPGYESIVFSKDFQVEPDTGLTTMPIAKMYKNHLGMMEFIDAFTPHVVFFPDTFSVTLPLWSHNRHRSIDALKKVGFINSIKKPLRSIVHTLGLSKQIGLNTLESFDYAPKEGKLYNIRQRVVYPEGTQKNHIQNLFCLLQYLGYDDGKVMNEAITKLRESVKHLVQPWADMLLRGIPIPDSYEPSHVSVPFVNITRSELRRCYPEIAEAFN